MSELPSHWSFVTLRELGGLVGGKTPTKATDAYWRNGSIPWTSPKDMKRFILSDSEDHISTHAVEDGGMQVLPENTILMVTRSGILDHTFPVAITAMQTAINQDIKALAPSQEIDPKYLAYALRHAGPEILRTCAKAGTTVPSVQTEKLESFPLPLAPLNEQKRIADKLETLLTQVTSSLEKLNRASELVKQFRQAVLAAATAGALTEDWRKRNGISSEWETFLLDQIAESRLGKMLDKAKNQGELTPYLRNVNVRWFGFDLSDVQSMRLSPKEIVELTVKKGDVLICEGGEPGRCAVWEGQENFYVYQKALHRVRVNQNLNPYWLTYCLKTKADSGKLAEQFTGTTIKHFTGAELSKLAIPLPSLSEQLEIVSRVETLSDLGHNLETRINTARDQLEKLTPALLAKAFHGELVSQDPTDEPASVLLKRIREARAIQSEINVTQKQKRNRIPRKTKHPKGANMLKSRLDEDVKGKPYLTEKLKQLDGKVSVEHLYQESRLELIDFFKQLSEEYDKGWLKESNELVEIV